MEFAFYNFSFSNIRFDDLILVQFKAKTIIHVREKEHLFTITAIVIIRVMVIVIAQLRLSQFIYEKLVYNADGNKKFVIGLCHL